MAIMGISRGLNRMIGISLAVILCNAAWANDARVAVDAADKAPGLAAKTVLITGSNRGIGLEFARQYAAAGWRVIATCRNPAKATELQALARRYSALEVMPLDVTEATSINRVAESIAGRPIHLLLNNAALLGSRNDQALGAQDYALAAQQFEVNTLGPVRVVDAFIDNVRAAGPGKIVTLGSSAGSNGLLRPPADFHSYRASKAATHFWMHNLAIQLASEGIIVGLINPGLVDTRGLTDLGPDDPVPEDFVQIVELIRSGAIQLTRPEDSVKAMIALIDTLTAKQSGVFLNFDGTPLPW